MVQKATGTQTKSTDPGSEEPLWCREPLEPQQILLLRGLVVQKAIGIPTNSTNCTCEGPCGAGKHRDPNKAHNF